MSDTNSLFEDHSFFGDNPNDYSDTTKQKDVTKNSSNAEKMYES